MSGRILSYFLLFLIDSDGVGTYVAMGGRTITCTSCRGRGFVVCRSCFSKYDEDPNDLEAIRELMSRFPD